MEFAASVGKQIDTDMRGRMSSAQWHGDLQRHRALQAKLEEHRVGKVVLRITTRFEICSLLFHGIGLREKLMVLGWEYASELILLF